MNGRSALRALAAAFMLSTLAARPSSADTLVFAAASLLPAMEAIAAAYAPADGSTVRFSFAATSTLARQIENGAPADLFVSANRAWMAYLGQRELIAPGSARTLATNRLVLIAPSRHGFALDPAALRELPRRLGAQRLAVADPDHVPAGIYAREALVHFGLWDDLGPRAARLADVRAVLALVARAEVAAGIVYASDAASVTQVRTVLAFPPESHGAIIYPAALIAGRERAETRALYDHLWSDEAQSILAAHGFGPPPAASGAGR